MDITETVMLAGIWVMTAALAITFFGGDLKDQIEDLKRRMHERSIHE